MTVLPELATADLCPVCAADHLALDEFWSCPRHGHLLQFDGTDEYGELWRCPAYRCHYQRSAPRKPRNITNGDPMTTVATRPSTAVDAMWTREKHLGAILPAHIDVRSFIGTAAAALYANADLMRAAETSPDTLITALMRCAALGHQPGTEEFYLTPRKVGGRPTILGIEGYRGIVERMYRSGAVASVVVREVCANDSFRYTEGADDKPIHSFGGHGKTGADFFGTNGGHDRGAMVGVYAYATLTTGAVSRVVLLTRADVEAARDTGGYRANDPYSPWNRMDAGKDHPQFQGRSMWWKTAARRLEPWVPTSAEYRREQLRAAAQATIPPAPAAGWLPSADELNDITDAEVVSDVPDEVEQPRATSGQQSRITKLLEDMGVTEDEETRNILAVFAGSDEPLAAEQLTQNHATVVLGHLKACDGDRARLYALITDGDAPDE